MRYLLKKIVSKFKAETMPEGTQLEVVYRYHITDIDLLEYLIKCVDNHSEGSIWDDRLQKILNTKKNIVTGILEGMLTEIKDEEG